ncbi:hypothetical protein UlMin_045465 [Ulmus minor]
MAEKSTSKRPQSLNDSHYRLLQDLSAPPKASSKSFEDDLEQSKAKIKPQRLDIDDDDDIPNFSIITDFDTKPMREEPKKVKIEGRRRLCKLSTRDNKENSEVKAVLDDPTISEIADFESPPLPPPPRHENGGDSEIMDILGDLSARLEFLSIEKRRPPTKINPVEDSSSLLRYDEIQEEKKLDLPEFASAGSSFSLSSHSSDSLSDGTKNPKVSVESVVYKQEKEKNIHFDSEGDKIDRNNKTRNVGVNFERTGHPFVSEVEVLKHNKQSEWKSDNFVEKEHRTLKEKAHRTSRDNKKSANMGKSYEYLISGKDFDDENDCVILSGRKSAKEGSRKDRKSIKNNDFGNVDTFDDSEEDSVLEAKTSVTFIGAKHTYKLPGEIAKMLYPHQRDGLKWLWSLHCQGKGGILGDDMGLGKTMQICGFLAGLFHSRLIKRAMIVAPKTLLPHWIKELSAVGLSEKTREYFGTCAKARQYELQYVLQEKGILLTTYDIVRNNSKSLRGDHYLIDGESDDSVTWDYMILDEGHLIKNPSTQRAKSLLEIPSAHRIIISGTPIQNNLKELWALFNFCCPELLGDKQLFKERFENAILRGNEKKASDREKRIGSEVARALRECIQPYFLRRLKTEVFNEDADKENAKLSKKNEIIVWLRLTSCQRQLYEAFLKSELVLSAFDGSPLAALTIMKKICDHPLLLTKRAAEDLLEGMDTMLNPEDVSMAEKLAMHVADVAEKDDFQENHDNVSCKISFILSLLDNLIPKGHNVLIFSQTRKMLNLIQDSLASNCYDYVRIDGTTKAADRLKIVDDFQTGLGAPIFLLTSQVGGLGLTLTRADRVIVVDPAWNPSTDNQSVDRAYRIGQNKDVIVYRLMTCGTVEEKIYRKQIYKGGLFKTATEHKEQIRYFSQQDLRELFSLPVQGFDISLTQQQLHEEHDSQHKMDEFLQDHVKFLESKGIAGVSHHSLLFSKTASLKEAVQGEEEEIRKTVSTMVGASTSSVSVERSVNGAEFAFNPKDVRLNKKSASPDSSGKITESEIKERIIRLSKTLANKDLVLRLPDKGEKLQKQIVELNSELYRVQIEKGKENEVIDLDSISGKFQRLMNV